eukprot:Sspe_Gene.25149::Locus_10078_Transcript_1_6_Confidence_0.625_Length_450::g.25149::m.25149
MGHGPSRVHVEDSWEEAYETDERLQQAIPDDFVRVTKRQNTWFMKHYSILTERLAFLACQEEEDAITDEYRVSWEGDLSVRLHHRKPCRTASCPLQLLMMKYDHPLGSTSVRGRSSSRPATHISPLMMICHKLKTG